LTDSVSAAAAAAPLPCTSTTADASSTRNETEELRRAYRELWVHHDACELALTRQRLEFTYLK
jgi:hypothetical protein